MHHQQKLSNNWSNIIIIIMEISTAPYLLKILQPKAGTKAIPTTISSHRQTNRQTHTHIHTHTHTHAHTHSHTRHHLKITCHQNTHTKRLKIKPLELHLLSLSLSLSLSPSLSLPTHPCTGAGHMQSHSRKSRVSSWTHREVLRVWFVH